jgi:hypothetical protein
LDTNGVCSFERTICLFGKYYFRNEPSTSAAVNRASIDALFELSVRADSALKTALCENASMTTNISKTNNNTDRITLRKSVSVMNQKQKTGSGRSLVRAKSDMAGTDTR